MTIRTGLKSQETSSKVSSRATTLFRGSNLLFLVLAVVGSLHVISMIGIESYRILTNVQGITALDQEIAQLQAEIAAMDAIRLNADDSFMEQLARCQSYVYPQELRFITELPEDSVASLACKSIY